MSSESSPPPELPAPSDSRLSLDALRGFDMFWIIGADEIVEVLQTISS